MTARATFDSRSLASLLPCCPADGYVLQMHRMPRHGARDVAFFQHGVLDTSLGWVSNGVVGSAAFAAFDAGFDVWLANSRSNAPRLHIGEAGQGWVRSSGSAHIFWCKPPSCLKLC